MATPIPTWQERLKACFQWRHRLMQVFGVPAAVGAVTAMGASSAIGTDAGMGLGVLVAAVGSVIAGYFITAGFDRKLVKRLQDEKEQGQVARQEMAIYEVLRDAHPDIKPVLERILFHYQSIEQVFTDGIDDQVEAMLQNSRPDLANLRDRAVKMAQLYQRLGTIVQGQDGEKLTRELSRLEKDLRGASSETVQGALVEARDSTARALERWQAAADKRRQIGSVLTVIEKNLQEFKLGMELRKADAAMSGDSAAVDMSELQLRLRAAGDACDELVGHTPAPRLRTRRETSKR
jgi:hypothetical protein